MTILCLQLVEIQLQISLQIYQVQLIAKGVKATNNEIIYLVIRVFWGEKYGIEHGRIH